MATRNTEGEGTALEREILNPATGEALTRVRDSTAADVETAISCAQDAFGAWASRTPRVRSEALHALADCLAADADEFARAESRNVGKPLAMARDEVDYAVDNLRFFAGAARCLSGQPSGEYVDGHTSSLRREPVGAVGLIAPPPGSTTASSKRSCPPCARSASAAQTTPRPRWAR
jgi:acyl-CoA reductase-like NAD-dependent aldehyde dehydrogenase